MPAVPPNDPFERWHQAWFVEPLEILGYHCRPPCLGSLLYLAAIDSPLLKLSADGRFAISVPHFLAALRILRDARWPFTATIDFTPTPHEEEIETAAASAVAQGLPNPIEAALNEQFLPWWMSCQIGPELLQEEGGRALTAPIQLALAVRVMKNGITERRAWTMPLPTLRFYAAAIAEQDGSAEFMTPETASAIAAAEQLPDLTLATDEELFEIVKKDRGEEFAKGWLERRRAKSATAPHGKN